MPLQEWFDFKIPKTQIKTGLIQSYLRSEPNFKIQPSAKVLWLGGIPLVDEQIKTKRGITRHQLKMTFYDTTETFQIIMEKEMGEWLLSVLDQLTPHHEKQLSFAQLKSSFETHFEDFELFWFSKPIRILKDHGLLVL